MRVRFKDPRIWRYALASIADLVDDGYIEIKSSGIEIRAIDPSKISLIEFSAPREGFEVFDIDTEVKIPVRFKHMASILRRADKGSEFALEYQGNALWVALIHEKGFERRFSVPLLSSSYMEEAPRIEVDLPIYARTHPHSLYSSYKIISEVGDILSVEATKKGLRLSGVSDLSEVDVFLDDVSLIEYKRKTEEDQRSLYTLDYIEKIAKASAIADDTIIEFGTDLPLKITLKFPQGVMLITYVAPRSE